MVCLGVKDRNARSAGCITQLDRIGLKIGGGEEVNEKPDIIEVAPPPVSKELKKRWSYFIRKVYETDPLVCPKCSGEMRIISFIDQGAVIKNILQHLGLLEECHARAAGVLLDLIKPAKTQFNSSLNAS